ncbi:MAG: hypothetical protein A2Y10_01050 [Planctomycetes bacterium GWF2_41_51]|nr:MAG: hypothetical protein A2Y10_01050 [Planctomycetes bacterium GWF2_41_51]HBG26533.1 hypothetical protein [Phycisphaerales bacterium]
MRIIFFILYSLFLICGASADVISLAGQWNCRLDPNGQGIQKSWYRTELTEPITLPGTTDEAGYGIKNSKNEIDQLTRIVSWKGKVWYQRHINIPEKWQGKRVVLMLERTKQSRVWFDENDCGSQDSLCTPHLYDLSHVVFGGNHRITICVDNSNNPPLGETQQLTEATQTNWNGIVGAIQLQATDPVWIEDVQVYPNVAAKVTKVGITIGNSTGKAVSCEISANAVTSTHIVESNYAEINIEIPFGKEARLWDEFDTNLYQLKIKLTGTDGSQEMRYNDTKFINFGMRQFRAKGTQLIINDKIIFLRGKVDCCVFPLTGYAPMDKNSWQRVFSIAKSYGINHYRFHSWCPPEAAFAAADEMGIYLQPELPNWASFGENKLHDEYLNIEAERILKSFGNHPSFVMFSLGNEVEINPESRKIMTEMVTRLRDLDSRHLYAEGSNNSWAATSCGPNDDFWVTMTIGDWENERRFVRGSFHKHTMGHINNRSPSTMTDYEKSIAGVNAAVISHEIGQYQVFPNFNEIPKYTGVLKARNFEVFRQRLAEAGMLDQASDFVRASGALAVICYREEIEAALRTKGLAGFQLLDLQDYPGQGTALVGILDAFMDSKGLIKPDQWRQFCSEVAVLVRMESYTWTTNDIFTADVQIANYGKNSINDETVEWKLKDSNACVAASGKISAHMIAQGCLADVGKISIKLDSITALAKLILEVKLRSTKAANQYPLWVYPADANVRPSANIKIYRRLKRSVFEEIKKGGMVLLIPDVNGIERWIPGAFQSDFWCYPTFKSFNPPGTMGILCNPNHPAFKNFPTEFHSNWQWWHLVRNGRSVILDGISADFRPLLQTIDNFERNHKLGLIFETKIGDGRLLVCGIDLISLQNRPEARQLLSSLLYYMNSNEFAPAIELTEKELIKTGLFKDE